MVVAEMISVAGLGVVSTGTDVSVTFGVTFGVAAGRLPFEIEPGK